MKQVRMDPPAVSKCPVLQSALLKAAFLNSLPFSLPLKPALCAPVVAEPALTECGIVVRGSFCGHMNVDCPGNELKGPFVTAVAELAEMTALRC